VLFEDLTSWNDHPAEAKLIAVGWLARGKPHTTGPVDRRVYAALIEMQMNPWQPFVAMGSHACELCQFDGQNGRVNLFIPADDGVIYVCPELIVHYVNAHSYRPPEPFCQAVLTCPPMRSMQYLRAIKERGGGKLLRLSINDVQLSHE